MKQIFLFLLTIPFYSVRGQETKYHAGKNKLSIGFNFSPDYNFRALKNNDGSSSSDIIIKTRNDAEIGKFGYTTGFNICFSLAKMIRFETGIQYSNKGYQTKKQDLIYQQPNPGLPVRSKFIYNYGYIDIPFALNFTMGKSKARFVSSAGFTTNFLIKETQTNILEYANGKSDKKKQPATFDYKKVDISPLISIGIDYKINDKMVLRATPTFRYGVLKIIDTPVTEYLWNAGIDIGFYYGLR